MPRQFLNRRIQRPATPAEVQALLGAHDEWQMIDAERGTLRSVLSSLSPACAIEVGVYRAGSLGMVAAHSSKVYALDIDPRCAERYASSFPNVEFVIGSSQQTLPALLRELQARSDAVDFVLIDGDHSEAGLAADIRAMLEYRPTRPLHVLMHDSFNPECRRAMQRAAWATNPHVHSVELDFVTGRLVGREDKGFHRQMWNGLALAIMLPEQRRGPLEVHANDATMFETCYQRSIYAEENRPLDAGRLRRWVSDVGQNRAPHVYEALKSIRGRLRS